MHGKTSKCGGTSRFWARYALRTPIPPQKKKRLAGKFQLSDKSAIDEKENVLSMGEDILKRLKDCFGKVFDINDI